MRLRKKDLQGRAPGNFVSLLILILCAVFMGFPLFYAVSNSLKPLDELWDFPPKLLVRHPTGQNFKELFIIMQNSATPFTMHLFITVVVTVLGTAGHLLFASMCAYALAKRPFKGRQALFTIVVFSLMFNTAVTNIPNFIVMTWLNLLDTVWALIIPMFGAPLGLFLMKQFMEQIPDTFLEAAAIDGAGEFYTFFAIALPNVKSALLTLIVFSVQALWNMSSTNFVFRDEIKPLGVALRQAVASGAVARAGAAAAVSVVMMAVPILVFLAAQSRIIETMTASGIKE